jgi:hypothetical protein
MKKFSSFLIGTEAAEIVELAVVLPLLFMVVFAIFSFARAYNIYTTVTRAAQEAARVAATPVSASGTALQVPPSCSSATAPGQFPPDTCVAQAAADVLAAAHLDPNQTSTLSLTYGTVACPPPAPSGIPPGGSCPTATSSTGTTVNICRNVVLNPASTTSQSCGAVVGFRYRYDFLPIPFVPLTTIQIPAQAQMRMEY